MAEARNLFIRLLMNVNPAKVAIRTLQSSMRLLGSTLAAVWRTTVVAGFFLAIRAGIRTIDNLKNSIARLTGEFANLNLLTTKTAAIATRGGSAFSGAFTEASTLARSLSNEFGFATEQIQSGFFTAVQAGMNLSQSLNVTNSALQLATVGAEDFQNVMNNLIGITRAFGVESNKIPQFADALTAAMVNSKSTLNDLFEGLRNVSSVASTAFGESENTFLDTTAALMTLNDAGIEGSKAGTRLRAAFQKLLGGTAKTTAAFTRYGVNLFKADAKSQKFLGTLVSGQKALVNYADKVNTLKQKQFDLTIAGQQSTMEYKNLEEELNAAQSALNNLERGVDDVYTEFTLAGGGLKSFGELLEEIGDKAPTEVIGRAFGIRGGEGIMRLLKDAEKFKRFKGILKEYVQESKKGESILKNIFGKFLETVLIKWQKLKNTVMNTFSVIFDEAFSGLGGLLDPLLEATRKVFELVQNNKDIFKSIFSGINSLLDPIFQKFNVQISLMAAQMKEVFTPGAALPITLQKYSYNKASGKVEQTAINDVGTTVDNKLKATLNSFVSLLGASFSAMINKLAPAFQSIVEPFVNGLMTAFKAKVEIWISIGKYIAQGMINAIKESSPLLAKLFPTKQMVDTTTSRIKAISQTGIGVSTPYAVPPIAFAQARQTSNKVQQPESFLNNLITKQAEREEAAKASAKLAKNSEQYKETMAFLSNAIENNAISIAEANKRAKAALQKTIKIK